MRDVTVRCEDTSTKPCSARRVVPVACLNEAWERELRSEGWQLAARAGERDLCPAHRLAALNRRPAIPQDSLW
ncbi:hypothetical protein [Streptacidiphilus cavernicola]|uniref:Uncharacterized protein n=1 Tax=Streptacidiphilus cavernicola TaxID=3342716 RepID=A0ABV6VYG4_9ACTN